MSARLAVVALLAACGASSVPATPAPATLIVRGGVVFGQDATAVAIAGDTIVAVGTDADIAQRIGPATRVIDAAGGTITPGLVDAHCHLYGLGAFQDGVDLTGVATPEAAAALAAAATPSAGDWIIGRGWDQTRWPGQAFPTRAVLDAAVGARPVMLRRVDGHAAWLSGEALRRAGIDATTPDPAGGRIVRDAAGAPTGVLVDNALDLVDRVIPAATVEQRQRRILAAAEVAVAAGLTGVHEMGIDADTVAAYRALAEAGRLPLRVYAFAEGAPATAATLATTRPPAPVGRFHLAGVKFFADGALGSRGARLLAAYADVPGDQGLWVTEPAALAAAVDAAVAGGWQVAVHAIGDAGNRATLDAYAAAQARHPGDRRPRLEHAQVLAPDDIPRLAALGVIASMQPTHATSDMPWAEARLGPARLAGAYAWRTLLDAGARLAFGSDFPVEEVAPRFGLYAATTRQDPRGEPAGGWMPTQRLTLAEALAAFTTGAAFAEFAEARRGEVRVGAAASLTVFDRPLVADASLLDAGVVATIVDGDVAYAR